MESKINISAAAAIYNEAKNLGRCLESVASWVKEIVVVDGGSTDDSVGIAKRYGAQVTITNNPPIFHINKQKALDACRSEWILQLDADEVVTAELRHEITRLIKGNPIENGFYIPRRNYFLGHWLRKGGQYPDYVIRLLRKNKGRFPSKSVHEQIVIDGKVGYLKYPLLHYSYGSVTEYWMKVTRYIELEARELAAQHVSRSISSWVTYFLIKPWATFFLLFVRHLGFIDGTYGLLFALFSALHFPLAFIKYYRNQHSL